MMYTYIQKIAPDRLLLVPNPINGAKDASLIKPITVTFSREMDSSTITINTFTIEDSNKNAITGITTLGQCCDVSPTSKLDYDTSYTSRISPGVRDLAHNSLNSEYIWSFTTVARPDHIEPLSITLDHEAICQDVLPRGKA